jgi:ABC-type dipeptide/oligopeptide/nickel transport system permease component
MVVGSTIGITLGVLAAYFRNTGNRSSAARFFALFGSSIPVFWLGLALAVCLFGEMGRAARSRPARSARRPAADP